MGNEHSSKKEGDIVNWYLTRDADGFALHGQIVVSINEEKSIEYSDEKEIGKIGKTLICDECLTIKDVFAGIFTLESGTGETYRLHYRSGKAVQDGLLSSKQIDVPSQELLNIAYTADIENKDEVRELDDRSDEEISKAQSNIFNIGLGKDSKISVGMDGLNLNVGGFDLFGGGSLEQLSSPELRTLCNDNGMSCRDSNGKYLSRKKLIRNLEERS